MFCTNCGSPVPDNASFCGKCGSKLKSDPAPGGVASPNPIPTSAPASTHQESVSWHAYFLERWKKFLSSPLILAMLVCATLLQVMNISSMSSLDDMLKSLPYYSRGMMGDMVEIMDLVMKGAMLFGILTIVSMWMVFFDGQKGGPRLSTAGLTILQVLESIALVLVCLCFGFMVYGFLELKEEMNEYSRYSYSSYYSSALSEVNELMLWVSGICIFSIVFLARILSLLKSVKTTMRTFVPTCSGAMFVGIVNILSGLLSVFLLTKYDFGSMNLTMILSLVCPFLYGIAAISYRNLMKELETQHIYMTR